MSTDKPTRAVAYLRVSSTRNRPDLISFDVQAQRCAELCAQRRWTLVEEIRDPDRKGSTLDRPGLNRARQLINDGKADVIVVYRLDRFARTGVKAVLAVMEITDAGGAVVSCHPPEQLLDTTDPLGRGIAGLLFSVNEADLERIRAHWRDAHENALTNGWWMGPPPLGYVKERRQPLRPHPTEAPIITAMFHRAATGESLNRLRRWLGANGIDVSLNSLSRLLRNRVYRGEMHRVAGGDPRLGMRRPKDPDDGQGPGPNANLQAHKPLIDEVTFRRAQRVGRKFGLGRDVQEPRLLSGLLRCAGCRSSMVLIRAKSPSSRGDDRAPYYRCKNHQIAEGRCVGPAVVVAHAIEAFVDDLFVQWLRANWKALRAEDDQGAEWLREIDQKIALSDMEVLEFNRPEVQHMLGAAWLPGLRQRYELGEQLRRDRETRLAAMNRPEVLLTLTQPEDYFGLDLDGKRHALASVIDFVFVRRTSRRGRYADPNGIMAERLRVIYRPDGDEIELPRPGVKTNWRPFLFGDESEAAPRKARRKVG